MLKELVVSPDPLEGPPAPPNEVVPELAVDVPLNAPPEKPFEAPIVGLLLPFPPEPAEPVALSDPPAPTAAVATPPWPSAKPARTAAAISAGKPCVIEATVA
eukprot:TRINITY_DN43515_c0_g1_i1.p3 TRINITY_DN43515_c0_g1~~TRINITY_DN43515_c0_g1_i1.p3  ORF type:complete len:102 (-),score=6.85 TRINITY_DN43515_c0_g1_i1:75-380(-)